MRGTVQRSPDAGGILRLVCAEAIRLEENLHPGREQAEPADLLTRTGDMVGECLFEFLQRLHRTAEGAARHHTLPVGRHRLEFQTGDSVEFAEHPLPHHPHALADGGRISMLKIQGRLDPHLGKSRRQIPSHTPETVGRSIRQNSLGIPVAGEIKDTTRERLVLLRMAVGELRQHLCRSDPDAERDPRPLEHLRPECTRHLLVEVKRKLQEGLIDRVDLDRRNFLAEDRHHPRGHVPVERVVGAKDLDIMLADHLLLLVQGGSHRDP